MSQALVHSEQVGLNLVQAVLNRVNLDFAPLEQAKIVNLYHDIFYDVSICLSVSHTFLNNQLHHMEDVSVLPDACKFLI